MEISEQSVSNWADLLAKVAIPDEPPMVAFAGVAPPFYQVPSERKWVNFEIKPIEERRRLLADAIRTALAGAGYEVIQNHDSDNSWKGLSLGYWFYCYSPRCTFPHSVMERTDGGCTSVCSSPWDNESAVMDMKSIAELHNAELRRTAALAPQERT